MVRLKKKIRLNRSMGDVLTDSLKALPYVDNILALQDMLQGTQTRLPGAAEGQAMAGRALLAPVAPIYTGIDTAIDVGGALATGGSPLKAAVGLEPHRLTEFLPEKVKKIKLSNVLAGGVPQIAADTLRGEPLASDYTVGGVAPVAEEVAKIALSGGISSGIHSKKMKMIGETEEMLRRRLVSIGKTPNEAQEIARFTVQESIKKQGGLGKMSYGKIKKSRDILKQATKQPKIKLKKIGGPHVQDIRATGEVVKRPKIVLSESQPLRQPLGKAGEIRIGDGAEMPRELPKRKMSPEAQKQQHEAYLKKKYGEATPISRDFADELLKKKLDQYITRPTDADVADLTGEEGYYMIKPKPQKAYSPKYQKEVDIEYKKAMEAYDKAKEYELKEITPEPSPETSPQDYPTAEEYVKSKINVFHGTPEKFDKFELNKKRNTENETNSLGIWLTTDKKSAEEFAKQFEHGLFGIGGDAKDVGGRVIDASVDTGKLKVYEAKKGDKSKLEEVKRLQEELKIAKKERKTYEQESAYRDWSYEERVGKNKTTQEKILGIEKEIKQKKIEARDDDSFEVFMDDRDQFVKYINSKATGWRERYVTMNKEEANKAFIQKLQGEGYDGVLIKDTAYDAEGEGKKISQVVIFNPENIKTSAQLTKEWEAAQKSKPQDYPTAEEYGKIPIMKYAKERLADKANKLKVSERDVIAEKMVDEGLMSIEDFNSMTGQHGFGGKVIGVKNITTDKPIPSKAIEGDFGAQINYIGQWQTFRNAIDFGHRNMIIRDLEMGKEVPDKILKHYQGRTDGAGDTGWADRELFKREYEKQGITLEKKEISSAKKDEVKYVAKNKDGEIMAESEVVAWNEEREAIQQVKAQLTKEWQEAQKVRCTNATLQALGIKCDKKAMYGTSVLDAIKKSGIKVRHLTPKEISKGGDVFNENITLGEFIDTHPKGKYYIHTSSHAMALVDGKLTDTSNGTRKRIIQGVHELQPKEWQDAQEYVYHGTSTGAAIRIQKEGLKRQPVSKGVFQVSFSPSEKYAQTYADRKGGKGRSFVLRTKKTGDMTKDERIVGDDIKSLRDIPINEIEVKIGDEWLPLKDVDVIERKGLVKKLKEKEGFARIGKGKPDYQRPETELEKKAWEQIVKEHQALKPTGKEDVSGKYAKGEVISTEEKIKLTREAIKDSDYVHEFVLARKIAPHKGYMAEEISRLPAKYRRAKSGYQFDEVLLYLANKGYEFDNVEHLADYLHNYVNNKAVLRGELRDLKEQFKKEKIAAKGVKKITKPIEKLGKPVRLKKAIAENIGSVKVSELSALQRSLQRQAQAAKEGVKLGREQVKAHERLKAANEEYKGLLKGIKAIKTDKMSKIPRQKIEEIKSMVDVSVPSQKTVFSLQGTLQALEANPELELPDYVLERVKRLDKRNKSNMTIDELRALSMAVKHYAKLESLKKRLRVKGENRRQAQVVKEAISQMKPVKEIAGDVIDVAAMKPTRNIKKTIGNLFGLSQDHYDLVTESLGGEKSVMHDVLFKQVKEGIRNSLKFKHDLREGLLKDIQELDLAKNWMDKKVKIGRFTFSNSQLVSIYLHSQNPDNLRHLKSGFATPKDQYKIIRFKEGELDKILEKIPEEAKKVAEIHWRYGDKVYDKIQEVFYEKNGYELPKVEKHFAIKVARGALPTDVKMEDALTELKGKFIRIGIQKGSTMKRVKSKLPLVLEGYFNAMAQHIDWASTYYGLEIPMTNASKLLYDRKFKANLIGRYGMDVWKNIEKGLRDIAGAHEDMTDLGKVAMAAKNKLTKVVYGANIGVFVKQTLSFPLFHVYVPAKYLMQGMVEHAMNPSAIEQNHMLMSPEFNERVKYGFNRDLADVATGKSGKALTTTKKSISDKLMGGLKFFDRKTVSAGMQGAILQKLDELKNSDLTASEKLKEAYKYADYVVNRTQPTFAKEHRSSMSRGNAMERMVTFATTATNMQRNLILRTYRQWKRTGNPKDFVVFAKALFYAAVIIPIGILVLDTFSDFVYRKAKPKFPTMQKAIGSIVGSWAANVYILRNVVTYVRSSLERGGYGGYGMDDSLTRYMKNLLDTGITSVLAIGNPKKRLKAIDGIMEQILFHQEIPYRTLKKLGTRAVQLAGWGLENFDNESRSPKILSLKPKRKLKIKLGLSDEDYKKGRIVKRKKIKLS